MEIQKRKVGRPRTKKQKRDTQVSFSLTIEEREQLYKIIEMSGLSIADFICKSFGIITKEEKEKTPKKITKKEAESIPPHPNQISLV